MDNEYYTLVEAIGILGISRSMFYYLVQQGQITRIVLPGAKHAIYRKEEIDRIVEGLAQVQGEAETTLSVKDQQILKALEHVEIAYSHSTRINLYLNPLIDALPDNDAALRDSIAPIIGRARDASNLLQKLQSDLSNLAKVE
jgi:predicted DNA-binding transcriptional regulator AlpA